jgi:hypothetical protein
LCAISYVLFTVVGENLDALEFGSKSGFQTGAFQLVRLIQFATLFWLVCQIPLTPSRLQVLLKIARSVLVIVCGLIIATFVGLVAQSTLVRHLPAGAVAAGPWQQFQLTFHEQGLGAVGYNHAYVAAHVTLLLGLCLLLSNRLAFAPDLALIALSTVAVALTASRAGLLAQLIFVLAYLAWRAWPVLLVGGILIIVLLAGPGAFQPQLPGSGTPQNTASEDPANLSIIERQRTAFSFQDEENLSGRDSIWKGKIGELNDDPLRWVTGWGFGTSGDHGPGNAAHMLPLQWIVELGLVGAALFTAAFLALLRSLWKRESPDRPVFWLTIALLVSSLTQETFYPVAAMGQFLGLYLVTLGVALRPESDCSLAPERYRSVSVPRLQVRR